MKIELSGHYGYRRIVKTMAPMILMMIVISVYSIVDGFFISNYAGSDAFAGMNIIWPAISIVGALGLMVGSGGSALVSKTFGEGDSGKANRIFSMLVRLTLISGLVMTVLLEILMPRIVYMLGSNESLAPHAILYGRIVILVLPLYMLQMAYHPFFMVAEKPQWGTVLSLACGITNIVFDALFIVVFKWGLAGAAAGTSLSMVVGGGYPLWFFCSRRNKTQLRMVRCRFDWSSIAKSCSNGLSEFVGNIALSIVSICYNLQLMRYTGPDGVSAYGIIMYLGFIYAAVFIGYNMGISQIVSYNYGAGNKEEMKSLLKKSLVLIAATGIAMFTCAELTSPAISRMFVGYDEGICTLAARANRIYMASFLICGLNMFTSAWFTALNNGVVSAIAAFVRTLVFELACVFILPLFWGVDGIWMSVNVAEVLALVLSVSLIVSFRRKYGY